LKRGSKNSGGVGEGEQVDEGDCSEDDGGDGEHRVGSGAMELSEVAVLTPTPAMSRDWHSQSRFAHCT